MSVTQTYYLAHTARRKLSKEASRADHDLRVLVSHANLLDSLMLELSTAEKEQERWFNQTVSTANKPLPEKHIQWADSIVEDPEEDWDAEEISDDSDSDSDSDLSDDDSYFEESSIYTASLTPLRRTTPPVIITQQEVSEDEEEDDEEDKESLALTRSAPHSPPELLEDLSDDSEEDVAPPSPPQPTFDIFNQSQHPSKRAELTITEREDEYISPHGAGTMIEAY